MPQKVAYITNSVDPDEVAHKEPPHLDLHYLIPLHDTAWITF